MVSQSFDSNSDTELAGSARLRWLVSVNKRLMKQLVTGGGAVDLLERGANTFSRKRSVSRFY